SKITGSSLLTLLWTAIGIMPFFTTSKTHSFSIPISTFSFCRTSIGIVAFFTTFISHYSFNTSIPTIFLLLHNSWWNGLYIRILFGRGVTWRLNNFWLWLIETKLSTVTCQWLWQLHLLLACFSNLF